LTYNAAQRLTTMQKGTTRTTYTYDNNGNITVKSQEGTSPQTIA
jgi:YD repeat-containing protein